MRWRGWPRAWKLCSRGCAKGPWRWTSGPRRVIHQVLDASEDCVGAFRENRIPEEPAAALRAMEDLLGIQQPEAERLDRRRPRLPATVAARRPAGGLAAGGDGAAAGRESGPAGAFDGPDSERESAAGERQRRTGRPGSSDRRNGGGMRPVSQGRGRVLAGAWRVSRSTRR